MTLSNDQRILVEENMRLVGAVIKNCIHGPSGSFDHDDLFQIGCIGLAKAAMAFTESRGKFSVFAYVAIRNEIYKALRHATTSFGKEQPFDIAVQLIHEGEDDFEIGTIKDALIAARSRMPKSAAKGVDALILRADGYTCREIGEQHGVSAKAVTNWISRARSALKKDSDFMAAVEGVV